MLPCSICISHFNIPFNAMRVPRPFFSPQVGNAIPHAMHICRGIMNKCIWIQKIQLWYSSLKCWRLWNAWNDVFSSSLHHTKLCGILMWYRGWNSHLPMQLINVHNGCPKIAYIWVHYLKKHKQNPLKPHKELCGAFISDVSVMEGMLASIRSVEHTPGPGQWVCGLTGEALFRRAQLKNMAMLPTPNRLQTAGELPQLDC